MNPIDELYLTYHTGMNFLLDQSSINSMMEIVVNAILEDDDIVSYIKTFKRKKRLYIGKLILNWIWKNSYFSTSRWKERSFFNKRFEEAFSEEVHDKIERDKKAARLYHSIKQDDNVYHIAIYDGHFRVKYDPFTKISRAVVKYNDLTNTFKICYVETGYKPDKPMEVELIKVLRIVIDKKAEEKCEIPKVICNKKYNYIIDEALKMKYLYKDNLYEKA